ncbi:ABC transporter ATP-binding protein [Dissulfurirhabdus thermomarina]|uniref:ABC transporter ATP-binding protein n=1 Tax=Dissulfurirhabdus thermomarina TaxID=1765737 RepID=A0A6N9TNX8_DISTH|nr:ABC transporter ATP-binding protein [Dissulfurirhabdus thermomarina]NDY42965.1 ABC transporter ATP-binding protein [Dissulfurirhabdus thermomarina]NMX24321.1 ABC transporter ATP-binding protein [Dissulfurirhabdus thermomarina]
MEATRPIIQMIGVEKSFGRQKVLDGVDLDVAEGKTTVIVGASGEGKSVIIKHMLGLLRPDRGRILFDGRDITRMKTRELRRVRLNFGVLFQGVALFDSMNIYDNVALPLRERTRLPEDEVRRIVREKLAMMDLEGVEEKYPAQLSGGMQKRAGLARALVLDPKVVFFDEPTTGLDVKRSTEIYRLFYRAQQQLGYTAVIVSHDAPKIFKLADYVALVAGGKVQACLPPEEFQLSSNPYVKDFIESTMGTIYDTDEFREGMMPL